MALICEDNLVEQPALFASNTLGHGLSTFDHETSIFRSALGLEVRWATH